MVKDIESAGGKAFTVQADMSDANGARDLCATADKHFEGKLDILVNNAGYFALGELGESSDTDF